jgi:3',5'-cyclic AMP phosphodiesterase CpdA
MRVVHISDLHFGAVATGLPDRLRASITEAQPDLVAVSGDLTMRGRKQEYQEARAFLDSLPTPQLVVPGNHDVQGSWKLWERFVAPWRNYRQFIDRELEPVFRHPGMVAIGANSARPAGWYLDWSRGRLSQSQMTRIASAYAGTHDDALRVLVVHHPPAAPPDGTARHLIGRLRDFSRTVNHAGIDLVLSGHFHMSYAQTLHLRAAPATRSCVFSSVSTATSHRLKGEPNGFHIIDGDARELRIQDWAWNGSTYSRRREWMFRSEANTRDWSAV